MDAVHGLPWGGCGDSNAEREFLSDKVYSRDDRGIVGVESLGLQCSAFVVIHTKCWTCCPGHAVAAFGGVVFVCPRRRGTVATAATAEA